MTAAIPAVGRGQPQRQPDLWPDIQDIGARRHDANHFAAGCSRPRFPTIGCPKRGLPQLVRENRDRRRRCLRIRPVSFPAGEQPSLGGLQSQSSEEMLVDVRVTHAASSVVGSEIHLAGANRNAPIAANDWLTSRSSRVLGAITDMTRRRSGYCVVTYINWSDLG